jgi:hypothetical protein
MEGGGKGGREGERKEGRKERSVIYQCRGSLPSQARELAHEAAK